MNDFVDYAYYIFCALGLGFVVGIVAGKYIEANRSVSKAELVEVGLGTWEVTNTEGDIEFKLINAKDLESDKEE